MISCYIPEHCTAIYCCVDIPKIGLSINAFLDIDLCSYKLSGGIERETFDVTMFNYEWGGCQLKSYNIRPKDIGLFFSIE